MKVLVVDDDPLSVELLTHALTKSGHDVIKRDNGRAALQIDVVHFSSS